MTGVVVAGVFVAVVVMVMVMTMQMGAMSFRSLQCAVWGGRGVGCSFDSKVVWRSTCRLCFAL